MYSIVVLVSGNGSNLQVLIDAIARKELNIEIKAVISDRKGALALERARQADIPTHIISMQQFITRDEFDQAIKEQIEFYQPDLIVLAGFMRMLSPIVTNAFSGHIINIHPSLLPKYKGLHTHERVIADGETEHGCTVHFVNEELDGGTIIAQAKLAVLPHEDAAELKKRIHELEHVIYPLVIRWFAEQRLKYQNHQAYLDQQRLPSNGIQFTKKSLMQATKDNMLLQSL